VPTYEYACKGCGEHLEVHQSFSDAALTECPNCAGALRKVFGNIAITFKGSGFYKTDSRASSNGDKGSSSSDHAGDSKSASKADPSKGDSSKGDASKGDPSSKREAAPKSDSTSKSEPSKGGSGPGEAAPRRGSGSRGSEPARSSTSAPASSPAAAAS